MKEGGKLGVIQVTNAVSKPAENANMYGNLQKEYKDVFTGLGKHKSITVKFVVDNTVTP
jgi:hypothetical protein